MTLPLQHRIELITPPASDVFTISDLKEHLRVEHDDEDQYIYSLMSAATSFVDVTGALGKALINQTWGEWIGPNPRTVLLSLGPVQSVDAIKYYDADNNLQTSTLSQFWILGTAGQTTVTPKTGYKWPTTFNRDDAIKIEYTIGHGTSGSSIPQAVRHAMLMLIGHYYENRENELIGTISKTLPFGFEDLINSQRSSWYG